MLQECVYSIFMERVYLFPMRNCWNVLIAAIIVETYIIDMCFNYFLNSYRIYSRANIIILCGILMNKAMSTGFYSNKSLNMYWHIYNNMAGKTNQLRMCDNQEHSLVIPGCPT